MSFGRKAQFAELPGDPLGRPDDLVVIGRIGTDAGDTEKLDELLLETVLVRVEVFVDVGHGQSLPARTLLSSTAIQYNVYSQS